MKAVTIALTNLKRFFRDRSNLFFVFIFPLALILVLGATFGGDLVPRVGVVVAEAGPLGDEFASQLAAVDGLKTVAYASGEQATSSVERGELEAAVIVPPGYTDDLRSGRSVTVEFLSRPNQQSQGIATTVGSIVTSQGMLLRAATFASSRAGVDFGTAVEAAEAAMGAVAPVEVEATAAGRPSDFTQLGQFGLAAQSELILFMFLTSLTGSAALIQTRRLGVAKRMISTPTPVRTVLLGEGLGRLGVAMIQGVFILIGTLVIFGVDWGDPVGAFTILLVFGLVGSGAAMLMGSLFSNDEQSSGMGVLLGLGLGALGGCMVPLTVFEFFSPGLYTAAHFTPHAWALEAFDELTLNDGTVIDILPQLGILLAFAAVLYTLAVWRLRSVLTR